jgi:hypothetical protein
MTLQELQQIATDRTQSIIGAWTDRPTGQTKVLLENYRVAYKQIETLLDKIYKKILDGVPAEDIYNEMIKFNRLNNLNKQIKSIYDAAAKKAGLAQLEISKTAISNQYYGNMYSVEYVFCELVFWYSKVRVFHPTESCNSKGVCIWNT